MQKSSVTCCFAFCYVPAVGGLSLGWNYLVMEEDLTQEEVGQILQARHFDPMTNCLDHLLGEDLYPADLFLNVFAGIVLHGEVQ